MLVPQGLNWLKQLTKLVRQANPHVCKGGWLRDAGQTVVEFRAEGIVLATPCSAEVAIIVIQQSTGNLSADAQAAFRMDG